MFWSYSIWNSSVKQEKRWRLSQTCIHAHSKFGGFGNPQPNPLRLESLEHHLGWWHVEASWFTDYDTYSRGKKLCSPLQSFDCLCLLVWCSWSPQNPLYLDASCLIFPAFCLQGGTLKHGRQKLEIILLPVSFQSLHFHAPSEFENCICHFHLQAWMFW